MNALLDIATAGLAVEEAIAKHAGELDAAGGAPAGAALGRRAAVR